MAHTSDVDIYRSAALLIRQLGEGALFIAAQRFNDMIAKADTYGERVWKRIVAAVEDLQNTIPPERARSLGSGPIKGIPESA